MQCGHQSKRHRRSSWPQGSSEARSRTSIQSITTSPTLFHRFLPCQQSLTRTLTSKDVQDFMRGLDICQSQRVTAREVQQAEQNNETDTITVMGRTIQDPAVRGHEEIDAHSLESRRSSLQPRFLVNIAADLYLPKLDHDDAELSTAPGSDMAVDNSTDGMMSYSLPPSQQSSTRVSIFDVQQVLERSMDIHLPHAGELRGGQGRLNTPETTVIGMTIQASLAPHAEMCTSPLELPAPAFQTPVLKIRDHDLLLLSRFEHGGLCSNALAPGNQDTESPLGNTSCCFLPCQKSLIQGPELFADCQFPVARSIDMLQTLGDEQKDIFGSLEARILEFRPSAFQTPVPETRNIDLCFPALGSGEPFTKRAGNQEQDYSTRELVVPLQTPITQASADAQHHQFLLRGTEMCQEVLQDEQMRISDATIARMIQCPPSLSYQRTPVFIVTESDLLFPELDSDKQGKRPFQGNDEH